MNIPKYYPAWSTITSLSGHRKNKVHPCSAFCQRFWSEGTMYGYTGQEFLRMIHKRAHGHERGIFALKQNCRRGFSHEWR